MPYSPEQYTDFILFIKRFFAWFLPALLGVSTKLAYESRLKKLTRPRVLASLIMACFVGYICDKTCTNYSLNDFRGIIVSLGALASESIVLYVLSNTDKGLNAIIKRVFNVDLSKNNPNEDVTEPVATDVPPNAPNETPNGNNTN